jgi:phage shock protein A
MPWDDPHDHLEDMEHAELRMLRWLMEVQVAQGRLLMDIIDGQEIIVADLAALTAALVEVKASAETASAAVLAALEAVSAQIADLKAQIADLEANVGPSQEQIDALTATAADADAIVDSITAAVTPVVPEA